MAHVINDNSVMCGAGTAVHALIGVDDVLVFALADAADGTCVSAMPQRRDL